MGVPVTDGVKVTVAPPSRVRVGVGVDVATTTSVGVAPCPVAAATLVGGSVGKLNTDVFVAVGSTNTVGGGAGGNGLIGRRGFARSAAYVPPTKHVHKNAKIVRMLTAADPYLFITKPHTNFCIAALARKSSIHLLIACCCNNAKEVGESGRVPRSNVCTT